MLAKQWWSDRDWWAVSMDRVIRSGAQAIVVAIGADQLGWYTHWYQLVSTVGTFMALSFLNSILVAPKVGAGQSVGQ